MDINVNVNRSKLIGILMLLFILQCKSDKSSLIESLKDESGFVLNPKFKNAITYSNSISWRTFGDNYAIALCHHTSNYYNISGIGPGNYFLYIDYDVKESFLKQINGDPQKAIEFVDSVYSPISNQISKITTVVKKDSILEFYSSNIPNYSEKPEFNTWEKAIPDPTSTSHFNKFQYAQIQYEVDYDIGNLFLNKEFGIFMYGIEFYKVKWDRSIFAIYDYYLRSNVIPSYYDQIHTAYYMLVSDATESVPSSDSRTLFIKYTDDDDKILIQTEISDFNILNKLIQVSETNFLAFNSESLYRSTDGGNNFEWMYAGNSISSFTMGGNGILYAVDDRHVLASTDEGQTWQTVSKIETNIGRGFLEISKTGMGVLSNRDKELFLTKDFGYTWKKVL